jgi:predicted esterase
MTAAAVRTIVAATHGRYLTLEPDNAPRGLLVGFHGSAETADVHLAALRAIPGADRWLLVAVQALHPFYTRDQRVVASWMTRQDRELAIADNLAYVQSVVETVSRAHQVRRPLVYAGFSQGGAMAYRAAAHSGADGLIVLAADVPPDLGDRPGVQVPVVLLGRGTTDPYYTQEKHDADLAWLARVHTRVDACVFEGGHEWTPAFRDAAAQYLERIPVD